MSKHWNITNYLRNITEIEEEDSEYDEQETSRNEQNTETEKVLFTTSELESESDSEEENIINKRPGQKRKRVLLTSESETDLEDQHIETATDGTVWEEINGSPKSGRLPVHIFRDMSGPTGYAKRHIMKGQMKTAFTLIIDQPIIHHILKFKYSDKSDTLNDRCMHLTNYSINKLSSNYSKNEDVNACHGHKWTIKSLWAYLSSRGVRTDLLWAALRSLVLRTILAGENSINNMIKANVESKYSCFELFGFDILLDADLIPWLLEVNISPSLHSELPLDSYVKAPLVQSVLNTALFNIPPKIAIERQREIAVEMSLPPGPICYDKRMYINYLSRSEKIKHNSFTRKNMEERDEVFIADKRPFMLSDNLLQFIASKKLPVHYE